MLHFQKPVNRFALLVTTLAFGGSLWLPGQVTAAISDLAGEWSITTNPVGPWAYGYLSANSSTSQTIDNRNFLETGATPGNAGFVPYNMFSEVSGGWTTGLGFPQAGVLNLPGEANTFGNGLNDWPRAAGGKTPFPQRHYRRPLAELYLLLGLVWRTIHGSGNRGVRYRDEVLADRHLSGHPAESHVWRSNSANAGPD